MLDNELFRLIIGTMNAQLVLAGIPGVPIAQANQPTQQGVTIQPAAWLYKLGDVEQGYPEKTYAYVNGAEVYTQKQVLKTMFQLSALATQNPAVTTQFTASDILNIMSMVLQSDVTIQTFSAVGVGILDIKDIPNPYFTDDRGRFEASPNLSFSITHTRTITYPATYVTDVTFTTLPVQ